MGCHHADGRRSKGAIANHFDILVRLRAVGNRPGHCNGVAGIDVLIHRNDQLAHAIAIIKNALHRVPRFLIVALFQTDDHVGSEINQRLHQMDFAYGIQPRLTRKRLTRVAIPIALILELSLGVTWLMIETQMGFFLWVTHFNSKTVLNVRGST